jgi:hypothetical protein
LQRIFLILQLSFPGTGVDLYRGGSFHLFGLSPGKVAKKRLFYTILAAAPPGIKVTKIY